MHICFRLELRNESLHHRNTWDAHQVDDAQSSDDVIPTMTSLWRHISRYLIGFLQSGAWDNNDIITKLGTLSKFMVCCLASTLMKTHENENSCYSFKWLPNVHNKSVGTTRHGDSHDQAEGKMRFGLMVESLVAKWYSYIFYETCVNEFYTFIGTYANIYGHWGTFQLSFPINTSCRFFLQMHFPMCMAPVNSRYYNTPARNVDVFSPPAKHYEEKSVHRLFHRFTHSPARGVLVQFKHDIVPWYLS